MSHSMKTNMTMGAKDLRLGDVVQVDGLRVKVLKVKRLQSFYQVTLEAVGAVAWSGSHRVAVVEEV